MKRGEIWCADIPHHTGRHPVLFLSRDEAYAVRDFVIMSPLTTRSRGLRTEVEIGLDDGLSQASVANLDVIITQSKRHLRERITGLRPDKFIAVDAALHFALGLEK